ncbi:MAG: hypothetical protein IJA73_03745 [Oscillospiraceae bacterium]|nr:hypothetical protein [Oscillospiraceae bacterium]
MTFQDLRREYPASVCICRPFLRDAASFRVFSWTCLAVVDTLDAVRDALARLIADGVVDAVPISTSEELVIDGDLAARYVRVFFGLE